MSGGKTDMEFDPDPDPDPDSDADGNQISNDKGTNF